MANAINAHDLAARPNEAHIIIGGNPHGKLNMKYAHLDGTWKFWSHTSNFDGPDSLRWMLTHFVDARHPRVRFEDAAKKVKVYCNRFGPQGPYKNEKCKNKDASVGEKWDNDLAELRERGWDVWMFRTSKVHRIMCIVDTVNAFVVVYAAFDSNHASNQDLYNPDLRPGGLIDLAMQRAARIRVHVRQAVRNAQVAKVQAAKAQVAKAQAAKARAAKAAAAASDAA